MNIVDFIFSFLSNFLILYFFNKKNFSIILLFPLLAFSGRWLASYTSIPDSIYYGYLEFFISILIFIHYGKLTKQNILLLLLPLSSLLSIFTINSSECLSTHIFFFLLMISGIGYFNLFSKKIKDLIEFNIIDKIIFIWLILGVYFRISTASQFQMSFLEARFGSSLWATNHISMIILLFLPLARNKYILFSSIFFLVIQFSRGVYGTLGLMFMLYFFIISPKKAIKLLLISIIIILSTYFVLKLIQKEQVNKGVELLTNRLNNNSSSNSMTLNYNFINSIFEAVEKDERTEIRKAAWAISKETNYLGVGLGNFLEGIKSINYPSLVSNAHNLYLTLLSEGGLLFLMTFLIIMIKIIFLAYKYDKKIFISLLCYMFYGFFNGQIYEESAFRSMIDFYYIIFIWTYLNYKKEIAQNIF